MLDDHLLPVLGQAQLVELTHAEVQAWVNRLASRYAPSSVRRSFTVLRQVLDFAVDNGLLALNPSERIVLPRREDFAARFLTPDELALLAETIDPRSRALVLVMAWATLRIGEALGLRRSTSTSVAEGSASRTTSSRCRVASTRDRRRPRRAGAR